MTAWPNLGGPSAALCKWGDGTKKRYHIISVATEFRHALSTGLLLRAKRSKRVKAIASRNTLHVKYISKS